MSDDLHMDALIQQYHNTAATPVEQPEQPVQPPQPGPLQSGEPLEPENGQNGDGEHPEDDIALELDRLQQQTYEDIICEIQFGRFHEWQQEYEIGPVLPADDLGLEEGEEIEFGFDIKIMPDGTPKIIEFHVNSFGVEGFKSAFQHGDISSRLDGGTGGPLTEIFDRYTRKDTIHHGLYGQTAGVISPGAELKPDQRYVAKPLDEDCGRGVTVADGETLSSGDVAAAEFGNYQIEPFLESKDFVCDDDYNRILATDPAADTDPTAYDGCLRTVITGEVEDGQLKLTDEGSYVRLAAEDKDSNATDSERYVANLKNGTAAQALKHEQLFAANTAFTAVERMTHQYARSKIQPWLN